MVTAKHHKAEPKTELHQGYLPDGEGGDLKPKTIEAVDEQAAMFLESRDQVAAWKEKQDDARLALRELFEEHEITAPYHVDHEGKKYAFKKREEPTISCVKVKEVE